MAETDDDETSHPPPKEPPIPPIALAAIAKGALQREGCVILDEHCKRRMREPDRDFSTADVMWVIENGDYKKYQPEWRDEHQNWLYFVVGKDLDGRMLKLPFTVGKSGRTITILSGQRYSKGRRV